MNRVVAQGDLRPLRGREHAMVELRTILAQRERLYALADATIDTSANDQDASLRLLIAAVSKMAGDAPSAQSEAADAAAGRAAPSESG